MFCPKCGSMVQDNAAFCANCGSPTGRQAATYNQLQRHAPNSDVPHHDQQAYVAPTERKRPFAKLFANNSPFAIMKLVGIVLLAICLFMPWFKISVDPLIDAANGQLLQTGTGYQMPKLGDLGISVLGLGDTLNETGQLYNWLSQISPMVGAPSQMNQLSSLQSAGIASWGYRLFGLAWIASIASLVAGATLNLVAKKGDKVLRIAAIIGAVTGIIGIIVAVVANGQVSAAIASLMRDSGIGSLTSLIGGNSVSTMLNNLFGFTLAPIVTILASIAIFIGSTLEKGTQKA